VTSGCDVGRNGGNVESSNARFIAFVNINYSLFDEELDRCFSRLWRRMPPHEMAYSQIGLIFWDLRRNLISNEQLLDAEIA
jgi:hypothetical protein